MRRELRQLLLVSLLWGGVIQFSCANVIDAVNSARRACSNEAQPRLVSHQRLNLAARRVFDGLKPADAVHAVGYEATQLASFHLQGFNNDQELQALLRQQSCDILDDTDAREIGYYQRTNEVWVLIGASRGNPGDPLAAVKRALKLVNSVRAQSRRCGDEIYAATTPLSLNRMLTKAGQQHSDEMARLRYLEHKGKDGSTPESRITLTGYKWKVAGENVAAGEGSVELVIQDWLGSPHHCANIMDPRFTDMGLAFAVNKQDEKYGIYWTQTFGTAKNIR